MSYRILKQSTASQVVKIGPFVDDTDYVTAETGLTIANTDIKLSKGGATTQVNKNSGGATHLANGVYYLTLDATDTNTLGELDLQVKVAGALLVREVFYVVSAVWRDAVHDTGNGILADVAQWNGSNVATPTVAGVPEVDITHAGGSAVTAISGVLNVNAAQISNLAQAADRLEALMSASTSGVATAGSATTITLAAGSSAVDDFYAGKTIHFTSGTGSQQAAKIASYVGSTRVATFDRTLATAVALSTNYIIFGYDSLDSDVTLWDGTAVATPTTAGVPEVDVTHIEGTTTAVSRLNAYFQGLDSQQNVASATATTIVFDDAALIGTDDYYNGMIVTVYGGTGEGQSRLITGYVGSTKTATVFPAWGTNPDATSDVIISPGPGLGADMVETDVSMYGATRNLPEVLNLLAALLRNEVNVDSNSIDVKDDAGTGNLFTYTISDSGTVFTNAEGV
jgi:hypothetical protein